MKTTVKKVKKSPRKSASARVRTMGSTIMSIAKKIRKANPRKKWTTCVSEAGKSYKRNNK